MQTPEQPKERFADIQMLRYRLNGFEELTVRQKTLIYCLAEATLWGRDITFDQFGKHNLAIRRTLEAIYTHFKNNREDEEFKELETYLKRVWFSNGIHHHYGSNKFVPGFSDDFLRKAVLETPEESLPLAEGQTPQELLDTICPVIFDPTVMPKRTDKADGEDIVKGSAVNYYEGVTQEEAEKFYADKKDHFEGDDIQEGKPSFGINSKLVKDEDGNISEETWSANGKYGATIKKIIHWLEKAKDVAEDEAQKDVIGKLIAYYNSGDPRDFDRYSIAWTKATGGKTDFINGFIEVYADPLGIKASWEGIVEYIDEEATRRTKLISDNAQWFEDHSPVDPQYRKPKVKGVTAKAICAAMLGGDEYPSTAIGINLPNADWIRAHYGSKSVTISNLTQAYNIAAKGSGMRQEFVIDKETIDILDKYSDDCDDLHTDLHECLGHGSGRLREGTNPDALKNYGNTIEEARADLFGLYYIADDKLIELGLLPDKEAYKANYYSYMLNGLMTQLVRILPGHKIEEAHMRNRALIAHWCLEKGKEGNIVEMTSRDGKTYVRVNDYQGLRQLFAQLLKEIQRIKSEGDYDAARELVETYAVNIDPKLHREVLDRYKRLNLAPYKGFINPVLTPVWENGEITDITVDYTEGYAEQMLRYSRDYSVEGKKTAAERLKEVKRSFRQRMNGITAQSMREKGTQYKLNWGVPLPELKEMAAQMGRDYELAQLMWKEDIRECRILATMTMPAEEMGYDVAEIWTTQLATQEMAEIAAFNLFSKIPEAPRLAYRLIAAGDTLQQICGFQILARLFKEKREANERGINEFIDQAIAALEEESLGLRKAATAAINAFSDLGIVYQRIADSALRKVRRYGEG